MSDMSRKKSLMMGSKSKKAKGFVAVKDC